MNIITFFLLLIQIQFIINESINNKCIHLQIYDNIAEITRPISSDDLPLMFTQQEWSDIRSDSIRLIGNCLNVQAQTISFNQTSLNGQKILIQRTIDNESYTEGIMIDETRNLVQDLVDNTFYYLTNDRIKYFSIPSTKNYSVDFVIESDNNNNNNEPIYLRYLQNNIKWKVRYDLLLGHNDTNAFLQAYAVIQNGGSSSLIIDYADLISGDINIQSVSSNNNINIGVGTNSAFNGAPELFLSNGDSGSASAPTISDGEELIGVYIYPINETFILKPHSHYILPLFRPIIDIERYGLIEKYFFSKDNHGNAQRAYRLRVEDTFLPKGQVFIRESDRLVGEIFWPDFSANETNEFFIGQDPDLQYIEYIQLDSRREYNETNISRPILSTYTIDLHLINNKARIINFEYRLKFYSQDYLLIKENTKDDLLQIDGSTIIGIFQVNENEEKHFKFTFENQ